MLFGVLFPLRQTRDNVNLRVAHYEFNYQNLNFVPRIPFFLPCELELGNQVEKALDKAFHSKTWLSSLTFYLGAEVYERLNRRREEDKSRRKMLDDILANIQVKFQK